MPWHARVRKRLQIFFRASFFLTEIFKMNFQAVFYYNYSDFS